MSEDVNSTQQQFGPPETEPAISAGLVRFRSCRWRCSPDDGDYCTHRDVLPLAGKDGFKPDAWCPDCSLYKQRRTPRKREPGGTGF